jgi:hypothetical protein
MSHRSLPATPDAEGTLSRAWPLGRRWIERLSALSASKQKFIQRGREQELHRQNAEQTATIDILYLHSRRPFALTSIPTGHTHVRHVEPFV